MTTPVEPRAEDKEKAWKENVPTARVIAKLMAHVKDGCTGAQECDENRQGDLCPWCQRAARIMARANHKALAEARQAWRLPPILSKEPMKIEWIKPAPGEVMVISFQENVSPEVLEVARDYVETYLKDVRVIVCAKGADVRMAPGEMYIKGWESGRETGYAQGQADAIKQNGQAELENEVKQ